MTHKTKMRQTTESERGICGEEAVAGKCRYTPRREKRKKRRDLARGGAREEKEEEDKRRRRREGKR